MDLIKASVKAYEIAQKRGLKENTFETLKHCAGEVLEVVKAFDDWQTDLRFGAVSIGVTDPSFVVDYKQEFENELADIIVCVLSICGQEGINIEKALERVFEKNERRVVKNDIDRRTF